MKKLLLFFIFISSFVSINSASAQLEFYEFAFNLYHNGERIADTNAFRITYKATEIETGRVTVYELIPSADTSESYGYDYNLFSSGSMLRDFVLQIYITELKDGKPHSTMNIIIHDKKSSAWTMLGIDKVPFTPGSYKITHETFPDNRRDRPNDNRYFPFLDDNFDWEKIKL